MEKIIIGFFVLSLILCPFVDYALAGRSVTATITAQNTGTGGVLIKQHGTARISGTFNAKVNLQRAENCTDPPTCTGATWINTGDNATWITGGTTVPGIYSFSDFTNRVYRLFVNTGNYSSGSVGLEIGSAD